jgi:hypothetical protein
MAFAYFATNTGSIYFGHHPVEEGEAWRVVPAETLNSLASIGDRRDFVASTYQCLLQKAARERVVVRD